MASRQSISSAGGSRPSSSLDLRIHSGDVAAELRGVVDLRRRNDELVRELSDVRLQLDGEKHRARDAMREKASALKTQREQLDREREHLIDVTTQRVRRDCQERFEREKEKETVRLDDSLQRQLKRKDEELRTQRADLIRDRDESVRRAVQECEERVRESVEHQAGQQRAKLMAEMWGLREQKMRTEQMLEIRIEAEQERVGELRRREEQHERDMDDIMKRSRTESVRDTQKIRLAERVVQSKDEDIVYFQQMVERLSADNDRLTDEVTRLRVAEVTERKANKAAEMSPKWRRRSDISGGPTLSSTSGASLSVEPFTPKALSPTSEKPPSAMASKIARLEATVKSLEEKIAVLKQENAGLSQKGKSPNKLAPAQRISSSESDAGSGVSDKDENATIRRLRKTNAELNSSLTQLKTKVKLLESSKERGARPEGGRITRHESLHSRHPHRPAVRAASSQGFVESDNIAATNAVLEMRLSQQKEKIKQLEPLQEENDQLVQHITRLTSERMSLERNADTQLRSALHDVESTLALRNAEIDLLNSRLRRLEDRCRTLESLSPAVADAAPHSGVHSSGSIDSVLPASHRSHASLETLNSVTETTSSSTPTTSSSSHDLSPGLTAAAALPRGGSGVSDTSRHITVAHHLSDSSPSATDQSLYDANSAHTEQPTSQQPLSNVDTPIQVRLPLLSSTPSSALDANSQHEQQRQQCGAASTSTRSASGSAFTPYGSDVVNDCGGIDAAVSWPLGDDGRSSSTPTQDTISTEAGSRDTFSDSTYALGLHNSGQSATTITTTAAASPSQAVVPAVVSIDAPDRQARLSLDNVISSLDNFSISPASSPKSRPRSPLSLYGMPTSPGGSIIHHTPSSGIIAQATFTAPDSGGSRDEQQPVVLSVSPTDRSSPSLSTPDRPATNSVSGRQSPFSLPRDNSLQAQHHNGFASLTGDESPGFDSTQPPQLGIGQRLPYQRSHSNQNLSIVSDLDSGSGSSSPASDVSPQHVAKPLTNGKSSLHHSRHSPVDDDADDGSWMNGSAGYV